MIFLLLDEKPLEGVYAMSIRSIFILIYLMMSLIGVVVLGGCTAVAPLTGATQSQLQPGAEADKGPSGETTDRQAEVAAPSVQPAQDLSTTVNMPIVGAIWTANEQGNSLTVGRRRHQRRGRNIDRHPRPSQYPDFTRRPDSLGSEWP
jgi:uncharacterized protein YceK